LIHLACIEIMLMNAASPVIVNNLTFSYAYDQPDSNVLNSISLSVSSGELIILTGASGSGKTTLLTLIGGLKTGAKGCLEVLGKNIISASPNELLLLRRQVGFIFQSHNLLPYLTASENIRVSLEIHDSWRQMGLLAMENKCTELLELLKLGSRTLFKPKDLSVGQKQRVSIARAIANKPKLILADEPTSSLDDEHAQRVITLLKSEAAKIGAALVIVTHDQRVKSEVSQVLELKSE
jgi:putative ABC transport system ATP-binding protein